MMRLILAAAAPALFALSLPASAQTAFERMEAVSVEMSALMNDAFVAQIPALEGNMPDPAWDDTLRTAYRCVYDSYVDIAGEAAVDDMITQMEEMVETVEPAALIDGSAPLDQPAGVTDEDGIAIVSECGIMEIFMTRMAESGAMTIMMQQQ